MPVSSVVIIGAIGLCAFACSRDRAAPAAPDPVNTPAPPQTASPLPIPPTVVTLQVTPALAWIELNASRQLALMATLSDGTASTVDATWTVTADLATVTASGLLTGQAAGAATVTAESGGRTAVQSFRVLPRYGGPWQGGYRVIGCAETGDWLDKVCPTEDHGAIWRLDLTLTQTDDMIAGTAEVYEDIPVVVNGTIALDGSVSLAGTSTITIDGASTSNELADWASVTIDNVEMRGQFTVITRIPGRSGELRERCELISVERANALMRHSSGLRPRLTPR